MSRARTIGNRRSHGSERCSVCGRSIRVTARGHLFDHPALVVTQLHRQLLDWSRSCSGAGQPANEVWDLGYDERSGAT